MSVTRNLPRPRALLRRRHRTVIASATLAAVTLLGVGCGGGQTYVKHIQHATNGTADGPRTRSAEAAWSAA